MYNKQAIIEQVKAHAIVFNIPVTEFKVTGLAAMVLHDLAENAPQIAVVVESRTMDAVRRSAKGSMTQDDSGNYTVFSIDSAIRVSEEVRVMDVDIIDDVKYHTRSELVDVYIHLYETTTLGEERQIQLARNRDVLIRALEVEELKKPLDVITAKAEFSKLVANIEHYERLMRFIRKDLVPNTPLCFDGPDGMVWFVLRTNSSDVYIYSTDVYSVEFNNQFANQCNLMKNWKTQVRMPLVV